MSDHDRTDPMWDGDAIAEAVGREIAHRACAEVWSHEPFLEWLGADHRARRERRLSATDEEMAMRRDGARLRARVLARQCGVGIVEAPPPLVTPGARGVPAEVLDQAAAVGAVPLVNLAAAAGAGRALWDEPVEQWVAMPRSSPRKHVRALALRIAGASMAPLLRSGDTVLVELGATWISPRSIPPTARSPFRATIASSSARCVWCGVRCVRCRQVWDDDAREPSDRSAVEARCPRGGGERSCETSMLSGATRYGATCPPPASCPSSSRSNRCRRCVCSFRNRRPARRDPNSR